MSNQKKRVLAPSLYVRFKCKGTECRYTCCKGWQITMSKKEYREWKKRGIISKGMRANKTVSLCPDDIKTEKSYAMLVLDKDSSCPYLTEEGLCQIQCKYGVKEMIATCRLFPRSVHSYIEQAECSFSLGCEKVLELLLEEKEGVLLKEEEPRNFEKYDSYYSRNTRRKYPKLRSYYDIQTLSFAVLQSDNMTMEDRILFLGMSINKIEMLYAKGKTEDVPACVNKFLLLSQQPDAEGILEKVSEECPLAVYNSVITALLALNFSDKLRNKILFNSKDALTKIKHKNTENPELEYYQVCQSNFAKWIKGKEYFLENIMVMCILWLNIPFRDLEKSLWENYLYLVWIWVMLKGCLSLYLTNDSDEEDMIDCCTVLFRGLGHNKNNFLKVMETFQLEGDSLAHIALLLKSC